MDGVSLNTGLEELSETECMDLLAQEDMGRVGVVVDGRPEVFPVNYALDRQGCILIRTAPGTKLAAMVNRRVVFEIDEVDKQRRLGRSVIVHGVAHHTNSVLPAGRPLTPWLPDRPYLVRITRQSITGRRVKRAR